MRVWVLALLAVVVACGCAPTLTAPAPTATGGGATITPTPTSAPGPLTQAKLKYRIVDRFGVYAFCDPDYYPVARADEQALARVRLPEIQNDSATFGAILVHLGIATNPPYTDEQVLAIYREWKMLSALRLDPVGAGFHFAGVFVGFGSPITPTEFRVEGTISQQGDITVASSTPSGRPPCPICLARGTRIATPAADVAVEDLKVGDIVWSLDAAGRRVALPLVQIGSTPVPGTHRVVHLRLTDGRAVDVSPGHPTADGRSVGDLSAGDVYDGAVVVSADLNPYAGGATFDVLPGSSTGAYWANGVLLGSTLR
jgi:hypothetical protein